DRKGLIQSMEWVSEALNILGSKREGGTFRLPVLASLITRDPHAFDGGTLAGNLLIDALCTIYSFPPPSNNQDVAEILYSGGILIDEISNFITIAGLRAVKGGKPHPVWDFAMAEGEMLQVPLANLVDIERITSPIDRVYVVENPAVFSALLDGCKGQEIPPLVCSYGQIKLAGLIVLDKLAREGVNIFYSGDFDPEGLLIANKLAHRYGDSFHLWRYGTEEYRGVVSEQKISLKRLSMLDLIDYPGLQGAKEEMKVLGRAGYQELLINSLLEDIDHR
ncbi:MAG: DUF2399 domain-containing protein, partial [Clostridiales bacterium]|nr:DUF2399 domain-containing protein [Clostridiales bacterium]